MQERLTTSSPLTVVKTDPDDGITRAALEARLLEGYDRVIAIGGDGTVHLVVDTLMRAQPNPMPSLGVIPFGTANDVAKSLGLPLDDPAAQVAIALGEHTVDMDVGIIDAKVESGRRSTYWVDSVTIGMDADVLDARRNYRDLRGYAGYAAALAERSTKQQSLDLHAVVDGEAINARVFNIVINNVPVYAGELTMPGARLDDQLFDIYLFNRREYLSKLFSFAIKHIDVLELGVHDLIEDLTENQRTIHGRNISIRLATPRQVQVDGEVFGKSNEINIEVAGSLVVAAAPGLLPTGPRR